MTGNAIFSSSGFPSWSFATRPSITDAATISPIFIAGPSRPCPGTRGTRSASGLDLREPVEDRAHVESHPECHLHHALLVHGLELADGDGHSVRLDQRPRVPDRHEALAEGRELAERRVRTVAERPEVHPEPLPRPWMQSGIIDIAVEKALLLHLRGLRGTGIRERVGRQPVLTPDHQLLVREDMSEGVELAVFRDS